MFEGEIPKRWCKIQERMGGMAWGRWCEYLERLPGEHKGAIYKSIGKDRFLEGPQRKPTLGIPWFGILAFKSVRHISVIKVTKMA